MAYSKLVMIDVESIMNLLSHYTEGEFPLDAHIVAVQASPKIQRWISLVVDSKDWSGTPFEGGDGYNEVQPFWIRYEGKRVMTLQHLKDPVAWSDENAIEAPKRQ